MLYTSEGLTFGLRPNALGLRSCQSYHVGELGQAKMSQIASEDLYPFVYCLPELSCVSSYKKSIVPWCA